MRHGVKQSGFTMVELLVVTTIIGILTAIAVPQFKEYRARAYDARAQSDLRNVVTAQEAYFLDNERYSADPAALPGFVKSEGVEIAISEANELSWSASSYHQQGRRTYCFSASADKALHGVEGIGSSCG